jgi:hypothetical protein
MANEKKFLIGFCLLVSLGDLLSGQGMNARITGDVKDEDGDYLSGVAVTAINVSSNAETTVRTEGKEGKYGAFRFLALAPGFYQVSFDLEGYVSHVAGGIRLHAEQSLNMHITLRRIDANKRTKATPANPETRGRADGSANLGAAKKEGRFSISLSGGLNYLAMADSDAYLTRFSSRTQNKVYDKFETLHSGADMNAEIGYRITPRWEVAVGMGQIQDSLLKNTLKTSYQHRANEVYQIGLSVKTRPLQLICRYQLGRRAGFSYGVYGAILFHFASWSMRTDFKQLAANGGVVAMSAEVEEASGQGVGFSAGGRCAWKMDDIVSFIVDLSGRYAPLRTLSGQRKYSYRGQVGGPVTCRAELWFYEFYNTGIGRWSWELGIGGRPVGPGTRHVSRAKVDFSGMALRIGLLFRF